MPDYAFTFCSECKDRTAHVEKVGGGYMCIRAHFDPEEEFTLALFKKMQEMLEHTDERRGIAWVSGKTAALSEIAAWVTSYQTAKVRKTLGAINELRGNHG